MAAKTVPAKSKSTTETKATTSTKPSATTKPATSTDESLKESITTIKQATCKNLQGTATLEYHIGRDENSALFWKIHSNTGAGMFSKSWIPFDAIQKLLDKWPKDSPITSITLSPLCKGSINTRSFLLATLVNEGILQSVPDKKRHYQLGDAKPFFSEVGKLNSQHSESTKGKPKAKFKAGARMSKGKAKPATS